MRVSRVVCVTGEEVVDLSMSWMVCGRAKSVSGIDHFLVTAECMNEEQAPQSTRAVSGIVKSWPGILTETRMVKRGATSTEDRANDDRDKGISSAHDGAETCIWLDRACANVEPRHFPSSLPSAGIRPGCEVLHNTCTGLPPLVYRPFPFANVCRRGSPWGKGTASIRQP